MLLLHGLWPVPWGLYVLRFRVGSGISWHTDPVSLGRHHRCNFVFWRAREGGEFECAAPLFATRRLKVFRPDACAHWVLPVRRGVRYVLSLGWVLAASSVPHQRQSRKRA